MHFTKLWLIMYFMHSASAWAIDVWWFNESFVHKMDNLISHLFKEFVTPDTISDAISYINFYVMCNLVQLLLWLPLSIIRDSLGARDNLGYYALFLLWGMAGVELRLSNL